MAKHVKTSFPPGSVRLSIDGKGFDVTSFSLTYALNEIPRARCVLATGRLARDVSQRAGVHDFPLSFSHMAKAKLTMKPSGDYDASGKQWPDKDVVVFDGYCVGSGYARDPGLMVEVSLVHWMVDLGFSTLVSDASHPSNPFSLAFPSLIRMPNKGGLGVPGNLTNNAFNTLVSYSEAITDVWGVIKTFLTDLADTESFRPGFCFDVGSLARNGKATAALSRIEGPSKIEKTSRPYHWAKPLALPVVSDASPLVANALLTAIQNVTAAQGVATSFWDVLVGHYCPLFSMMVVPLAESALIVADTPGLRTPHRTLVSETFAFKLNAAVDRPLRAVGVYTDTSNQVGPPDDIKTDPTFSLGGCYIAADRPDGAFLYVAAPPWVGNAMQAIGLKFPDEAKRSASHANEPAAKSTVSPSKVSPSLNDLLSRYAHWVYLSNVLRGRSVTISGKLRFDIAPGSIVRLVGITDPHLPNDKTNQVFYGQVDRVTISVSADPPEASTSFSVSNIRSSEENQDDDASTDEHPLFGKGTVNGAPLVDAYAFQD